MQAVLVKFRYHKSHRGSRYGQVAITASILQGQDEGKPVGLIKIG